MQLANSTRRLEIPPFVMIFPARTKNAIAIMEVESSPPKILCVTTLNVSVISGENMMADMVAIARETAIGTPSISRTINDPKSKNPVMMIGLPSDCFLLSLLPLLPFFPRFPRKDPHIHTFPYCLLQRPRPSRLHQSAEQWL